MAFFEDLSKKATEASAKALEFTKGFSDAAVLKSTVSTEEKNIKEAYYQMGELYYSTHHEDYEEPFGHMIQAIDASKQKIEECKEQIKIIKDIHYCEKCGAEVPNSSYYCSSCGFGMEQYLANTVNSSIQCKKCGNSVEKGLKFCTSCGAAMSEESSIPASNHYVRCKKCGSNVEKSMKFCTSCGAAMKDD